MRLKRPFMYHALCSSPFSVEAPSSLQVEAVPLNSREWRIQITATEDTEGTVSLRWDLSDIRFEGDPWWMLPGCFYGTGCRDTAVPVPLWGREADGWEHPCWQVASDRITYPLTAVLLQKEWRALSADPHYRTWDAEGAEVTDEPSCWGEEEPQMGFGFGWEQHQPHLSLHLPANEGPKVLRRQPNVSATDKRLRLKQGMRIEFTCRCWQADTPEPQDRRGIHACLKEVYGRLAPTQDRAAAVPAAEIMSAATHGLMAWHWMENPGYMAYTVAYDRCQEFNANLKQTTLAWHFEASGFVGVMPVAFALLWQSQQPGGDPEGARAAYTMMHRWCSDGVAPNGLFRGSFHPGKAWTPSGLVPNPAPVGVQNSDPSGDTPFYGSCWLPDQDTLHARTAADAILYLSRYLSILDQADPLFSLGKERVREAVQCALRLQREDGSFGFIYDLAQDKVREWEGEAGMWWLPALGEASGLFADDPELQRQMLKGMQRAGTFYADIHRARPSGGAPEDIRLALSSESPQAGVMGYRYLYELDPDGNWLEAWKDSADWLLSFQKVFNQRFSPHSMLSGQNFRTFGAQNASTQNTQVHCYGLQCVGDFIRLSQTLDDPYYAERAREHTRYSWQMLCLTAGHWGGQRGMCTEQFYTNDWSIFDRWNPGPDHQQKGSLMGSSHSWCIAFMLLSLEQLESVGELVLDSSS